jgi:hypothetical protein
MRKQMEDQAQANHARVLTRCGNLEANSHPNLTDQRWFEALLLVDLAMPAETRALGLPSDIDLIKHIFFAPIHCHRSGWMHYQSLASLRKSFPTRALFSTHTLADPRQNPGSFYHTQS